MPSAANFLEWETEEQFIFDKFVHSVSTKNNIKKHFRKKYFQHFYVEWIKRRKGIQASSYKPTHHKILAQEEI